MKNINVGVVGCGYWGPNLIRNLRSLPDCCLTVMCDVNEDRVKHLRTVYPEVAGERRFESMLARADVDAVAVATPVHLHFPMAKASLLAGKHTLIEKPMAASTAQCEELIEIARKKGLVLMVGHTFLYSAPVRKIKQIVDSNDIGEIRYISARRLNLGLFQKDINVAWDLAPHDISIILFIMNELPHSINCRGGAHIVPNIEDVTSMSLHFSKERSAIIHSSWHDPRKVREMTIVGSKRMIVYDDILTQEKIKIFDARVEHPPHYDTFAEFQYAYHYGDIHCPYIKQDEPLKTECQHFLECIRTGNVPLTGGAAGLAVVRILEASSESLRLRGAPVSLMARRDRSEAVSLSSKEARFAEAAGNHSGNGDSTISLTASRDRRETAVPPSRNGGPDKEVTSRNGSKAEEVTSRNGGKAKKVTSRNGTEAEHVTVKHDGNGGAPAATGAQK